MQTNISAMSMCIRMEICSHLELKLLKMKALELVKCFTLVLIKGLPV